MTAMPPRPCQSDWQQRGADAEQDDGRQAGCPYPERRPSENDQPQEPKSGAHDEECKKRELQCLSDRL